MSAIDAAGAEAIARREATPFYRRLSEDYVARIATVGADWQVELVLRHPTAQGGGPSFLIDGETGSIKRARFEQ